ncbi:MAG: hypothetical protein EA360_02820 [Balneolaceae bacterium]|nr:MAG: hypothetical protein EA360_02820 [Balneolaceae bacterium]
MKPSLLLLFSFLIFFSCTGEDTTELTPTLPAESPQEQFFATLFSLCGETFAGESTYPEDGEHVLTGNELRAVVKTCTDEYIKVDFLRESDTWHATWVLSMRENGLHLYHDHVGDKTPEELGEDNLSGYGGYADERGSATRQFFPADEATAEMIPEATTNVWMMEMDLETGTFVYYLERHSEPRFRAELTLSE